MAPQERVACDKCDKTFTRQGDLNRHSKLHLVKDSPEGVLMLFTCDQCGHTTFNGQNMRTHKLTHSKEKKFSCPKKGCNFGCNDPASLFRHRKSLHGYVPRKVNRIQYQKAEGVQLTEASGSNVVRTATTEVATPEILLQPATRPDPYTAPAHSGSTSTFSDLDLPPPSPPRPRYRLRIEDLLNPERESD